MEKAFLRLIPKEGDACVHHPMNDLRRSLSTEKGISWTVIGSNVVILFIGEVEVLEWLI